MFENLSPRIAIGVGLLALVPAIVFAFGRSGLGGLVASINVLIIVSSLYLAMSPVAAPGHARSNGH